MTGKVFYQTKKSIHLLLIAAAITVVIALVWHFGVSPLSLSPGFGGRFAGITCLIFGSLHTYRSKSHDDVITKGTKLVKPSEFNRRIDGDGIGIPFVPDSYQWGKGKNKPNLLRIRAEDEPTHIMIVGDTGSGKSALQHSLLLQIRDRQNESAIVYDPSLEFWKAHGDPENDYLLYPFSKDAPYWDITDEIANDAVATALANSFIPDKIEGRSDFWESSPRRLLKFLLLELKRQNLSTDDLVKWIADGELLNQMVEGTDLEALIDPNANAQRAGVLASLSLISDALKLLPPNDGRPKFSFRRWAKERNGWIFIGTKGAGERAALRPIISAFLDTAFNRLLENEKSKPCWILIDEMASLQRLPKIREAMTEARKYNCRLLLGFQGRSQLEALYGKQAEVIMSSTDTRVFLKTTEYSASEWIANNIGKPERQRQVESFTSSLLSNGRDSISTRTETRSEHLILPNQIQNLKKLSGYLRYDDYATFFRFPYPEIEKRNKVKS